MVVVEEYQNIYMTKEVKVSKYFKSVIQAVKKTRCIKIKCEKITEELQQAIASENQEYMRSVLQKYMHKYIKELELSPYIKIVYIHKEDYERLAMEDIKTQLRFMIGFVYDYEAKRSVAKEIIKKCLEKTLHQKEGFSKEEIAFFLR